MALLDPRLISSRPYAELDDVRDNEVAIVGPGHYAITNARGARPLIGTLPLDDNLGIALFNRRTRVGIVAEIEMRNGVLVSPAEPMSFLLSKAREIQVDPKVPPRPSDAVEVYFIGGGTTPCEKLQHTLEPYLKVVEADLFVAGYRFDVGTRPHANAFLLDTGEGVLRKGAQLPAPSPSPDADQCKALKASYGFALWPFFAGKSLAKGQVLHPDPAYRGTDRDRPGPKNVPHR